MEGSTKASADQIEQELAERLDQEIFEPPAEFREKALIQDESVYEEAARDPVAWWAKQSEELLDWAQRAGAWRPIFPPWSCPASSSGSCC